MSHNHIPDIICEICQHEVNIVQMLTCPCTQAVYHSSHQRDDECPLCGCRHEEIKIKELVHG